MSERFWFLKRCGLFEQLPAQELSLLESRAKVRRFERDSAIYLPGDVADGVLLLSEGRVRICDSTPEGKQLILAFIEPGELFGELSLIDQQPREERAEAALASTVILISGDAIQRVLQSVPALSLGITKLIGFRRRRIERRLKTLLFRSNRERLVHLLLELAEQYGSVRADGILIDIRLSHQDLANIIGSTRETVTVTLGELQGEGMIRIARQSIVLTNAQALGRGVDLDPKRMQSILEGSAESGKNSADERRDPATLGRSL